MKPRHWIFAFASVALLALGLFIWLVRQLAPPAAEHAELDPQQAEIATRLLDHLNHRRFAEAHAMLGPSMAEALTVDMLSETWEAMPGQLGGEAQRGAPRGERVGGHLITTIPLRFPAMTLDARISVDTEGRIDGLRLLPASIAAEPPSAESGLTERTLEVNGLGATLSLPNGQGPWPAVVLVHGSGPLDRDESLGPNKPFRDLAHGLAAQGIVVLRYEKHTFARPQDFADQQFTVDRETVDDAVAAAAVLRAQPEVAADRVYVLGHSLGAMMAPRIGERDAELAGLILLAAPARPLQNIVADQLQYLAELDGSVSAQEQHDIDAARLAAEALNGLRTGTVDGPLPLGLPAAYWQDLLDYDPRRVAAALTVPMLILQGGRDYQVTLEDFDLWQQGLAGAERVTLQLYPAMNHLFAAGEGPPSPQEYLKPTPVDSRVIRDIGAWINTPR